MWLEKQSTIGQFLTFHDFLIYIQITEKLRLIVMIDNGYRIKNHWNPDQLNDLCGYKYLFIICFAYFHKYSLTF